MMSNGNIENLAEALEVLELPFQERGSGGILALSRRVGGQGRRIDYKKHGTTL